MTRNFDLVQIPASREPRSLLAVDRAISELRRGRMVAIRGHEGRAVLMLAAEAVTDAGLSLLAHTAGSNAALAVTGRRAAVLQLAEAGLHIMLIDAAEDDPLSTDSIRNLADPLSEAGGDDVRGLLGTVRVSQTGPFSCEAAAVQMAKMARLLPAAMVAEISDPTADDLDAWAVRQDLFTVDAGDVFQYDKTAARSLTPVSEAWVPLQNAENTRIIAFRPNDGGLEHLAIIIGEPGGTDAVLVRLHSECFTGDLLGSLKCDCGDQLRGAIDGIATAGSGVLLYLAQEGRGIGLVNKLRAYELQDRGFDTLDANEQLGFDADERVYLPAAQMLRALEYHRIRLLTNNPEKISALAACGVEVVDRVPHSFPSNKHNEMYLDTKAQRSGHLI
jgi:GTP cyclohydrolase II